MFYMSTLEAVRPTTFEGHHGEEIILSGAPISTFESQIPLLSLLYKKDQPELLSQLRGYGFSTEMREGVAIVSNDICSLVVRDGCVSAFAQNIADISRLPKDMPFWVDQNTEELPQCGQGAPYASLIRATLNLSSKSRYVFDHEIKPMFESGFRQKTETLECGWLKLDDMLMAYRLDKVNFKLSLGTFCQGPQCFSRKQKKPLSVRLRLWDWTGMAT